MSPAVDGYLRSVDEADALPANPAAAPGSSGPGEHGYGGEATVGDEGAAARPESYADPFGRPDDVDAGEPAADPSG